MSETTQLWLKDVLVPEHLLLIGFFLIAVGFVFVFATRSPHGRFCILWRSLLKRAAQAEGDATRATKLETEDRMVKGMPKKGIIMMGIGAALSAVAGIMLAIT
jgi:hypothetical protein